MDIVQTIILLVSAIAAAYAVVQHRRLTKKTSTLQVILSDTSDSRIVEASSNVYKMITSNKNFYQKSAVKPRASARGYKAPNRGYSGFQCIV